MPNGGGLGSGAVAHPEDEIECDDAGGVLHIPGQSRLSRQGAMTNNNSATTLTETPGISSTEKGIVEVDFTLTGATNSTARAGVRR